MNDDAIAAQLVAALTQAATREAGAQTTLVSVNIEMIAPGNEGEAHAALTRKTRTLVFMSADYIGADGVRIATAASVHKILA